MNKLYVETDAIDLHPFFGRHMLALTAENLVTKADIAKQLAIRDQIIARLSRYALMTHQVHAVIASECGITDENGELLEKIRNWSDLS